MIFHAGEGRGRKAELSLRTKKRGSLGRNLGEAFWDLRPALSEAQPESRLQDPFRKPSTTDEPFPRAAMIKTFQSRPVRVKVLRVKAIRVRAIRVGEPAKTWDREIALDRSGVIDRDTAQRLSGVRGDHPNPTERSDAHRAPPAALRPPAFSKDKAACSTASTLKSVISEYVIEGMYLPSMIWS
jgi:hypothetical protein